MNYKLKVKHKKTISNDDLMEIFFDRILLYEIFKYKKNIDNIKNWKYLRFICSNYELITRNNNSNIINRAFYKLWEIVTSYDLHIDDKEPMTMACLCEAPGGFIQSLIHYRKKFRNKNELAQDKIYGISLKNSSSETKQDIPWKKNEDFSRVNLNLFYGNDKKDDGNLLNPKIIKDFINKVGRTCKFVTADGGMFVEEEKENYKEFYHSNLFLSEIYIALSILKKYGCFVLKMYDITTDVSYQLLYILHKSFKKIDIFKPKTSREVNGERYIICINYMNKDDKLLNDLFNVIKKNWKVKNKKLYNIFDIKKYDNFLLNKIIRTNNYILSKQYKMLNNIMLIKDKSDREIKEIQQYNFRKKKMVKYNWFEKTKLKLN